MVDSKVALHEKSSAGETRHKDDAHFLFQCDTSRPFKVCSFESNS